jgi:ribosomal protein S19E (S16A)
MHDAITEDEIATLRRIASGEASAAINDSHIARLRLLGYVQDTTEGPCVTQEGMMWIVGGTDD